MITAIGLLFLGLLLLVGGGEALLRGAVGVATLVRLTPAVIGLTVVAAGTSVPELAVSAVAGIRGQTDITVGNVVGSNIFNITFIIGLAALIRPIAIRGNTTRLEYPVLVLISLGYLAVAQDGEVNALDAVFLLAVYVGFTAYLVSLVRGQMTAAERVTFGEQAENLTPDGGHGHGHGHGEPRPRWWTSLGLVALGVALLTFGASATVEGAVDIGRALGMSERLIGLTIVSIGTGLPEVVTSVVSSIRGRDDVAIGNVIGSNLFNTLVILGVTGAITPLPISPDLIRGDNWWMLGVTLGLFPLMVSGMRINRLEGVLLVGVYGVYLTLLLGRGTPG